MTNPRLDPHSWSVMLELIKLHGHEALILALRLDQMRAILAESDSPADRALVSVCLQCGQHIPVGEPCGCGARP